MVLIYLDKNRNIQISKMDVLDVDTKRFSFLLNEKSFILGFSEPCHFDFTPIEKLFKEKCLVPTSDYNIPFRGAGKLIVCTKSSDFSFEKKTKK